MDFDFEYDMYNPSAQARNETRKKRKCRFPRISEMPWQFINLSLLIIVFFGALLTLMLLRETPSPHEECVSISENPHKSAALKPLQHTVAEMSLLPAVVSFALLASAISALPHYEPLYAPRGAPIAAYRPRLPYNHEMYPAYPQYYYNYFYGHPAYRYAPYGYTPREYAPEAYAPGQAYYPMYDEEGRRFKGFWGDLKRTAVEIKDEIKNKAKGILGRVFGKDEQVKPTQKVKEQKRATPEPVVDVPEEEVAEEPKAKEEQGFKSGTGYYGDEQYYPTNSEDDRRFKGVFDKLGQWLIKGRKVISLVDCNRAAAKALCKGLKICRANKQEAY
ncbi:hypothetical protein QR680_010421 [Steinernema hermaphroditum]|uniref:Uncharacterized protein n=1 Tax=Steinernema hermaphroditum TaxID=289476 RepID=A0AA39MBN8_9BILA|nr:hypothetical protein QR680_010421 [Steinernema hermaphroditum]